MQRRRERRYHGEDYTVTRNPTDRQGGQDGRSFGEFSVDGPRRFPFVVECKAEGLTWARVLRYLFDLQVLARALQIDFEKAAQKEIAANG